MDAGILAEPERFCSGKGIQPEHSEPFFTEQHRYNRFTSMPKPEVKIPYPIAPDSARQDTSGKKLLTTKGSSR
jgi:hypothetical protein